MMKRVTFKKGTNEISFGLHSAFVLSSTEGFSDGNFSRNVLEFIDTDGVSLNGGYYEPRTVTVKGFIRAKDERTMTYYKQKLTSFLDCREEGILEYENGARAYQSVAVPDGLPVFGTPMQGMVSFVAYFMIPGFYWQELPMCQRDILNTEANLIFPFTFPGPFSIVTTRGNVVNSGPLPTPCKIHIRGTLSSFSTFSLSQGLEILNHTTKTRLLINYDITEDEEIIIDTAEPYIESSLSGNILNKIDFGESGDYPDYKTDIAMKLAPGANDIECINYNPSHLIRATISYYQLCLGV